MHGLGDNIHQRAILRQLLDRGDDVWLRSSWVAPYHDLVERGLKILRHNAPLRTQAKNRDREAHLFHTGTCYPDETITVSYPIDVVKKTGSVLAAMCQVTGVDYETADFRMPVPAEWEEAAYARVGDAWGRMPSKPMMFYRPLVVRTEWSNAARNPDFAAYKHLFDCIRDRFFVVSVADLVPGVEWIEGHEIEPDLAFHHGELDFPALAGLISLSALVYCSPGFSVPLAQAVSTPVACIFGGYENSRSFSAGARYSPYLGVDPIVPCNSWSHDNRWPKEVNIPHAEFRLRKFLESYCGFTS
jgi:hypothetical protein